MGAEVHCKNTNHQRDSDLEIIQSLQQQNTELALFIPKTPNSTDESMDQTPVHLMPPAAAEVLVNSSSEPKQKQNRSHNPKRLKSSVLFVVDSVDDFKVTKRLGIIWITRATSKVISPAEVPADATWLSKNISVLKIEVTTTSTRGGVHLGLGRTRGVELPSLS